MESKPIEVYKSNEDIPIIKGFLIQNSTYLKDNLEIEVSNVELFDICR